MARKFIELKAGCMAKAFDDEPTFVLLARDPVAPAVIRAWIALRIETGENGPDDHQIQEAMSLMKLMEDEQAEWSRKRRMQKEGVTDQDIAETIPPRYPEA
jgi:hypothetical protein